VVESLAAWQVRELGGRAIPPGNLHVTLAFLGSRPGSDLDPVAGAVREAAGRAERPELEVRGYRETRSVGMLVCDDRDGRAAVLADDLFRRLEALGVYERERRPWVPHVTVTRFRRPLGLDPELPALGRFRPSDAAVYLSRLHPTGAQYEVLESFALGG
jgi:2'-5' RNA ligase